MGPYNLAARTRLLVVAGTVVSFVAAGITPVAAQANTTAVVPSLPGGTASSATYLLLKKKKKKKKKAGKKKPSSKKKKKKKKKKSKGAKEPSITPESAEAKRQAIRDSVASDAEAENWGSVADGLESNAALLGDPVTMLEAGDARYKQAKKDRSVEVANQSIETTSVALDMLYFYDAVASGSEHSTWLVIDPGSAPALIAQGDDQIADAEELIDELESEEEEEVEDDGKPAATAKKKKKKKKRDTKPGTGMIIAGAAFTTLGAAGMGVGFAGLGISSAKQKEVEDKMIPEEQAEVDKLDDEGRRANILGFVGLGLAAGALAVGIPLIVIGVRKRKKAPSNKAHLQVAPMLAGPTNGVALQGKF